MADQRSKEMLAFNFASRTFAFRRLAGGLKRSLSVFCSSTREYLDPVIKADQSAQGVDDIGIADNDPQQLLRSLKAAFTCIQKTGLKLTIAKRHFGIQQVDFLGHTIKPQGVNPRKLKIVNFLEKVKFSRSKKNPTAIHRIFDVTTAITDQTNKHTQPIFPIIKND